MKQCIALLLCVLLMAAGALAVSAETTTAPLAEEIVETVIITETTYYEVTYYEETETVQSGALQGAALGMLILGGTLILSGIALLCIFLFAFPRWGLVKKAPSAPSTENEDAPQEDDTSVQETEAELPALSSDEEDAVTEQPLEEVPPAEDEPHTAVKLEDLF